MEKSQNDEDAVLQYINYSHRKMLSVTSDLASVPDDLSRALLFFKRTNPEMKVSALLTHKAYKYDGNMSVNLV